MGEPQHVISAYLILKIKIQVSKLTDVAKENFKWNMAYLADDWQASLNYQYQGKSVRS